MLVQPLSRDPDELASLGSADGTASSLLALEVEACLSGTLMLPARPTFSPDIMSYVIWPLLLLLDGE